MTERGCVSHSHIWAQLSFCPEYVSAKFRERVRGWVNTPGRARIRVPPVPRVRAGDAKLVR